jgi:hypothetical protein
MYAMVVYDSSWRAGLTSFWNLWLPVMASRSSNSYTYRYTAIMQPMHVVKIGGYMMT